MDDTTLPPEMLPRCASEEAEVIVCRGRPQCDEPAAGPCPFCMRIAPGDEVASILQLAARLQ